MFIIVSFYIYNFVSTLSLKKKQPDTWNSRQRVPRKSWTILDLLYSTFKLMQKYCKSKLNMNIPNSDSGPLEVNEQIS